MSLYLTSLIISCLQLANMTFAEKGLVYLNYLKLRKIYYLVTMIENKDPVDIIHLDFRKAFDTVPHVRLLKKIRSLSG